MNKLLNKQKHKQRAVVLTLLVLALVAVSPLLVVPASVATGEVKMPTSETLDEHTAAIGALDTIRPLLESLALPYVFSSDNTEITIKSVQFDVENGLYGVNIEATRGGKPVKTRSPVWVYNPPTAVPVATYKGDEKVIEYVEDPLQAFENTILEYVNTRHLGEPENDDTLIIYASSTGSGDTIDTTDQTWDQLRAAGGDAATAGPTRATLQISTTANANEFDFMYRTVMQFNTSPISGTVDNASLDVPGYGKSNTFTSASGIAVVGCTPAVLNSLTGTDYSTINDTRWDDTDLTYAAFNTADTYGQNIWNFSDTGKNSINKTGYTALMLRFTDDVNNTFAWESGVSTYYSIHMTTVGLVPKLIIEYTPDTSPPASVTGLNETATTATTIRWNWTDPADADLDYIAVYLDNVWQENITAGTETWFKNGLSDSTLYTISTFTVDTEGNQNATWVNDTATTTGPDVTAPASVTGLNETATSTVSITWEWNDPGDVDLDHIEVYVDNVFKTNVTAGDELYTAIGLTESTLYTISTRTVDFTNNVNATWVNDTATTSAALTHPMLYFTDINDVPGYKYNSTAPWSTWESIITTYADIYATRDFSDPTWGDYDRVVYRAQFARYFGEAWQITKNPVYLNKAYEAIYYMDVADYSYFTDWGEACAFYAIAYDMIQPELNASANTLARDKIANFTDYTYNGITTNYAADYTGFDDTWGSIYPFMAIVGLALEDYVNGTLTSTPADWIALGTTDYFVSDSVHSYSDPVLHYGFDARTGKHLNGAYYLYTLGDGGYAWFAYAYNTTKGNPINTYPVIRDMITYQIWDSLPNKYDNNYITSGTVAWKWMGMYIGLLDEANRTYVLQHDNLLENGPALPDTTLTSLYDSFLMYLVYDDYSGLTPADPADYTSVLRDDSNFNVFRQNWSRNSEWLGMTTYTNDSNSNRDMMHHDVLGIEYYSHGELLFQDGGEIKNIVGYNNYGTFPDYHNTVLIENVSSPFSASTWSNSTSRGWYKGDASYGIVTEQDITGVVEIDEMEMLTGSVVGRQVCTGDATFTGIAPITQNRTVMFPNKEYFIIFDRLASSSLYNYRTQWRPTSLDINTSAWTENFSGVGNVLGTLTLDGSEVSWIEHPFKTEYLAKTDVNTLMWNTTSAYNDDVYVTAYTVPSSDVYVNKYLLRAGGYGGKNEVYGPIVAFRNTSATEMYRATALVTQWQNQSAFTFEELAASGNGNGMKVIKTGEWMDTAIVGDTTNVSAGNYTTNAKAALIRESVSGEPYMIAMSGGYCLEDHTGMLVNTTTELEALVLVNNTAGKIINITVQGDDTLNLTVQTGGNITAVERDMVAWTDWKQTGTYVDIWSAFSSHNFTIHYTDFDLNATAPVANFTGNVTSGFVPFAVMFNSTSTNATSWAWDFNEDGIADNTTENATYVFTTAGLYDVNLTVTNAGGTDTMIKTNYINASDVPVADFTADVTTGLVPLTVTFTDLSTYWPTSWEWDFNGDLVVDNTTQNPVYTYTSAGTYTVSLTATNLDGGDTETKVAYITVTDGTAPGNVTGLTNTTFAATSVMWIWSDPGDADLDHIEVYFNGTYQTNVAAGGEAWAKAGLTPANPHTIAVRPVDATGNTGNWTNHTAWTAPVPPAPPVAGFVGVPTSGSSPLTVAFTDTSTGTPTGWAWDFNGDGVNDSALQNPTHAYGAGLYTVRLTVWNAGGSSTHTKAGYISVGLVYTPTPTATAGPINTSAVPTSPIDFKNGTYTKYWINTTAGGIDFMGLGYAVFLPFINLMGYWWFAYIYFLYLGAVWFRGQRVSLPLTIGFLAAGTWGVLMPPEVQFVANIIFALAIVAVMMRYLLSRWS